MRAFVEPTTYDQNGLALSWLVRIYEGDDEPALCYAQTRDYAGVCTFVRERIDSVAVIGLHGRIDRHAIRDMMAALRRIGLAVGEWRRSRGTGLSVQLGN